MQNKNNTAGAAMTPRDVDDDDDDDDDDGARRRR